MTHILVVLNSFIFNTRGNQMEMMCAVIRQIKTTLQVEQREEAEKPAVVFDN